MTNLSGANLNNGEAVGPQGEGKESPSTFPRYPAYKDSGVEWMGEVPAHWNVAPVGMYYEIRNGFPFSADNFSPEGAPEHRLIRIRDILGNDSPLYTDESCPVQCIVENGDILIGMDGDFNIASWAEGKAKLNQRVCAIRGSSFSWDRFFFYGIGAPLKIINDLTFATTVKHLASSQVLKTRFPIPPETEVDNIARFLDHETARIDALIEEQQRLIELLKEKRQAVISHAVTKGLDPTVPMKDSGVEWLGEVPAHWDVCSVRRVISAIEQGWSPECEANPADEDSWGVLKAGCVNRGVFDPSENKTLPAWLEPIAKYEVRAGDILMSRASGSPELVGSTALLAEVREKLMLSDKIFRIHLETKISSSFFVWVMNAQFMRAQIEQALSGGNGLANNLPQSSLLAFWLAVPPSHEQVAIAEYINKLIGDIDALISEGGYAVELLQERRSALISAAVTGKIDVRGWQPPVIVQAPESAVAEAH